MNETREHAIKKLQLRKDIGHYAAGGVPAEDELARAPRLESWHVLLRTKADAGTLDRWMSIGGKIFGDARFDDGSPTRTSPVVWFDRHLRFVRTQNSLYRLGDPAGSGGDE